MKSTYVPVLLAPLALAGAADAAFVGMNVISSSVTQGGDTFYVFKVYAKFNNANDTVLNAYGMNALPAGNFWHNDLVSGAAGSTVVGTWGPAQVSPTTASLDSWVTVGGTVGDFGNTTTADPQWGPTFFGQAGIPADAGWYNSFPPNLQGRVNPGTLQTLLAQFVFKNTIYAFSTPITVGYNQGLGTPTQFGNGTFSVPAPGAVALLGLAGLVRRSRRGNART